MPDNKGRLYVISAPSGAGKSTLCSKIRERYPNIQYSVSFTTRSPRKNETDGIDYFFTDKNTFKKMAENNDFLEWAEVHGNYYGTSKKYIDEALNAGADIFLDIDPQGAMQLKTKLSDKAVFIFISAPSIKDLKSRLRKRGTDSEEIINTRLKNAKKEVEYFSDYDYVIINGDNDDAIKHLEAVYIAEKLKSSRFSKPQDFMELD